MTANKNKICFYLSDDTKPPKLLFFMLHGCGGNAEDILTLAPLLKEEIGESFVAIAPEAGLPSVEGNDGYQWFDIENNYSKELFAKEPSQLSNDERKAFMRMALGTTNTKGLFATSDDLKQILSECQKKWNLDNAATIILGYSQGGMTAIDLAMSRDFKVRKAISISGSVIPPFKETLQNRLKSKPEIVLLHGTDDEVVSFNTAKTSLNILTKLGCSTYLTPITGKGHGNKDKEFWKIVTKQIAKNLNPSPVLSLALTRGYVK